MKVLFSLFLENYNTHKQSLIISKWVVTEWNIKKIENYLHLKDGFRYVFTFGQHMSFWDIYCFNNDIETLSKRIEDIPSEPFEVFKGKEPRLLRVQKYAPGGTDSVDHIVPDRMFLCNIKRYECGASGYEALVLWMSSHPIGMIFIAGIVYDSFKWVLKKIICRVQSTISKPIVFKVKRFYKKFGELNNIDPCYCQIIEMIPEQANKYIVVVRTVNNEKYNVCCNSNGDISSVKLVCYPT